MLFVAQEKALYTNTIKSKIDKQDVSSMCRINRNKPEPIMDLTNIFTSIAQTEYNNQHGKDGKSIHWEHCKTYDI